MQELEDNLYFDWVISAILIYSFISLFLGLVLKPNKKLYCIHYFLHLWGILINNFLLKESFHLYYISFNKNI